MIGYITMNDYITQKYHNYIILQTWVSAPNFQIITFYWFALVMGFERIPQKFSFSSNVSWQHNLYLVIHHFKNKYFDYVRIPTSTITSKEMSSKHDLISFKSVSSINCYIFMLVL